MPSPPSESPFRTWLALPERLEGDWPLATAKDSLVAHLNFRGDAALHWQVGGGSVAIPPRSLCWLRASPEELRMACRLACRERHECLTLVFPDDWLRQTLRGLDSEVGAAFRPLVSGTTRCLLRQPLTDEDEGWARGAMPPHLCMQARQLLDSARLTDFLIRAIFRSQDPTPVDGAISRTLRVSQERISRVKELVLAQLETPPSLDELATTVGCNPSHLSRTFTQIEGCTLSRWLRRARIEQAATLIASGRCNVSEAALEVGYQSFSHFSRAFAEEKGVPPSQWVRRLNQAQ